MLFLIASSLSEHHHTGMRKSYREQKLTDGHKQEKVTKFFLKLNAIQQLYKLEQNTHRFLQASECVVTWQLHCLY